MLLYFDLLCAMRTKKLLYLLTCTYFFFFLGCTQEKRDESDLIHINVSVSYPINEIRLEEVAKVEFLQLGMHDDFLFRGNPRIITENKIILGENNGDILIFSQDGKPIFKFNRRGQGAEEFINILGLIYDEVTDEFFVHSPHHIVVYSSSGKFKRRFPLPEGAIVRDIGRFDRETLILYDDSQVVFMLISKKNGEIVEKIDIPTDERMNIVYIIQDERGISALAAPAHRIVRYKDGFLLTDFALDTVFFLSQNRELTPILTRSPAIQSMSRIIYLNSFVEAGNYQFFSAVTVRNENGRLPRTYLMRDKRTGAVYRQRITFDDFSGKEITLSPQTIVHTQNSRLGLVSLDLTELQDANNEGRLSGRLKEIVENSEEDGNNVFMLLHFK